jgi:hypothetical protein
MAPTALNSANTDYEGLELVVEWLKAHSDSRNDSLTFEGTPLALNDTGYTGPDRVADWSQASSDSRNEDDELVNRVAAADLAAGPRQRLDPNGRFICTHEGCGMTFRCTQVLHRHEEKHNPALAYIVSNVITAPIGGVCSRIIRTAGTSIITWTAYSVSSVITKPVTEG